MSVPKPAANASTHPKNLSTASLGLGGNSGEGVLSKSGQAAAGTPVSVGGTASPEGHSVIVTLAVELLGVGVFTLLAGISNDVGKIMVIFMVGFWLIYALTTSSVIAHLGAALGSVANQAS